jgi:hypothetical protein
VTTLLCRKTDGKNDTSANSDSESSGADLQGMNAMVDLDQNADIGTAIAVSNLAVFRSLSSICTHTSVFGGQCTSSTSSGLDRLSCDMPTLWSPWPHIEDLIMSDCPARNGIFDVS